MGFVGLTLVAFGTSLPELVTAVTAARRGHDELIIGNLLGSNLFNSLAVGAVIGLLGDGAAPESSLTGQGVLIMLLVCIGVFLAMVGRKAMNRLDGTILLSVFVGFLILSSPYDLNWSQSLDWSRWQRFWLEAFRTGRPPAGRRTRKVPTQNEAVEHAVEGSQSSDITSKVRPRSGRC